MSLCAFCETGYNFRLVNLPAIPATADMADLADMATASLQGPSYEGIPSA